MAPDGGAAPDGGTTADAGAAPDGGGEIDGGGTGADGGADVDGGPASECITGDSDICGSKIGVCRYGTRLCADGRWGLCVGGVAPSPEICDGLDNDCNGIVDDRVPACECLNGASRSCGVSAVGECRLGMQTCVDGTWAPCVGNVDPAARQCDDRDRDCDGTPDYQQPPCVCRDGTVEPCGSSVGICRPGSRTCVAGQWGACLGGVGPRTTNPTEAGFCNGEDDNCNGQIDEGCGCTPSGTVQDCGTDVGLCELGTQTCQVDGTWGPCQGGVSPTARVCDTGDHDCDGTPDYQQPPCQCLNGSSRPCGTDVGECVAGTQTCVGGQWGACQGSVGAAPELCDGKDNDCDNVVDNGLRRPTAVACWVRPGGSGQLVCTDPHNFTVPPLATVALDGRQSSDPDGQALSYRWRIASAPAGSTVTISNPTSARPDLFAQLAGDYLVCLTVTDTTSCASDEACVTIHVVPSSRIHIQLVWDRDETDVDLHFMLDSINNFLDDGSGPPGQVANCSKAKDCSFICKVPSWGGGGSADDPRLDIDDVDGYGPENINLDAPFNQNPYVIAVHYWCDRPGPQYNGNSRGSTEATVRLYIDGILIREWKKRLQNHERWYVADVAWTNGVSPPYVITDRDQVTVSAYGCP
jgi:hypothetical protein